MWDLIVSVPDHCLSLYFPSEKGLNAASLSRHYALNVNTSD